jgi:hypothetical protein
LVLNINNRKWNGTYLFKGMYGKWVQERAWHTCYIKLAIMFFYEVPDCTSKEQDFVPYFMVTFHVTLTMQVFNGPLGPSFCLFVVWGFLMFLFCSVLSS